MSIQNSVRQASIIAPEIVDRGIRLETAAFKQLHVLVRDAHEQGIVFPHEPQIWRGQRKGLGQHEHRLYTPLGGRPQYLTGSLALKC